MAEHGRGEGFRLSVSATVLAVTVVGVCAAWAVGAGTSGWVGAFLRSRLTLVSGSAFLVSIVILYFVLGAMWRLARARRAAGASASAEDGSVAVEMVLLLPIALAIVLIMVQSTLLLVGNLAVHYAAYMATRAAVVWVPEKVSEDEARNVVSGPGSSVKLQHIKLAAVYAVMPVGASKDGAGGAPAADGSDVLQTGITQFFGDFNAQAPGWVRTMLKAKFDYANEFTEVTLGPPADGIKYGDHEDLHVSVRHQLYIALPYVGKAFATLGGATALGSSDDYATEVVVVYALGNQGVEDDIDVEVFPRQVGRGG
jgi:hypothetical protein